MDHNMDKVSICIPVYNLDKYIAKTIESILSQTYKNIEIVIVDDGSTDFTLQIINEYKTRDSRVIIISNKENKGPMYSRQIAVDASSGNYITFCDGDDTLRSDYVEKLLSKMKPDVDLVVGQILYILESGEAIPYHCDAKLKYGNDKESVFLSVLRGEMPQGLCGKLFRATIIKNAKVEVFEHCTRGEDACVLFQYLDYIRNAVVTDDFLYNYYQRSTSSTNSHISNDSLYGICLTSSVRSKIVSKYPSLKKSQFKYFQTNLINTFKCDCSKRELKLFIKETGLSKYLKPSNILYYSGIKMFVKYLSVIL